MRGRAPKKYLALLLATRLTANMWQITSSYPGGLGTDTYVILYRGGFLAAARLPVTTRRCTRPQESAPHRRPFASLLFSRSLSLCSSADHLAAAKDASSMYPISPSVMWVLAFRSGACRGGGKPADRLCLRASPLKVLLGLIPLARPLHSV